MNTPASETAAAPSQFSYMPASNGQNMLLTAADFPVYQMHLASFFAEHRPQNARESDLVQRLADTEWRMNRIARLEMGFYARGNMEFVNLFANEDPTIQSLLIETHTHTVYARQLNNLSMQESRLRRYFEKDLAELIRLQAHRLEQEKEKAAAAAAASSVATETSKATATATAAATANGFEFSNSLKESNIPVAVDTPAYLNGKSNANRV